MDDDAFKANLHNYLKHEREALLSKLDGLYEYDARRPLTITGTDLLGLVKHLTTWQARGHADGLAPVRPIGRTPAGDTAAVEPRERL